MLGQHSSIPTQSTGPVNGQTTPTAQSNLPGKLPSNLLFRVNAVLLMVTSRGAFVSSDLAGALKFVTSDLNSHEGKTAVVSYDRLSSRWVCAVETGSIPVFGIIMAGLVTLRDSVVLPSSTFAFSHITLTPSLTTKAFRCEGPRRDLPVARSP
ncbi:hypothetical protein PCANC_10475 [Puccinia coronata f. sp. avenae]|uniref:Uncharacterized protein n=1 Tax=Puccinia coronata f. sp. avenae TaxID=200324 RepID=A0A2N5VIA1_9BASI|nr:hypothetical protein PCASD_19739 [Puccinia coronata f. sp. avenae]PLW49724.1 hypothetical protein PCANC_10475 [Puccinia coronata f. sp. avenae]